MASKLTLEIQTGSFRSLSSILNTSEENYLSFKLLNNGIVITYGFEEEPVSLLYGLSIMDDAWHQVSIVLHQEKLSMEVDGAKTSDDDLDIEPIDIRILNAPLPLNSKLL